MKKILVGSPVNELYDYCLEDYLKGLKSLTYPYYDILLVDNSKGNAFYNKLKSLNMPVIKSKYLQEPRDRMIQGRNILRSKAIKENYDFFLNLDQDVIPPKDIIERFLEHKRRAITGIYFNYPQFTPFKKGLREGIRHGKVFPTIWVLNRNGEIIQFKEKNLFPPRLIPIRFCGSGCLFIHKSILKKINFHYSKEFDEPKKGRFNFDDAYFCNDLKDLNIPLYADTSMVCKHLIKQKKWIWDLKND
tara:strand:+ start:359 stop:1096 length:738 start_codon:yes stop_codon:yes gene_type:complete